MFLINFVIGKLYITGGLVNGRGSSNQAEELDVSSQTGEVKALPPMVEPRRQHTTATAGPFVFAFGGWGGQNDILSSCELYDSRTNTWVQHVSDYVRIKLKSYDACSIAEKEPICLLSPKKHRFHLTLIWRTILMTHHKIYKKSTCTAKSVVGFAKSL